MKVTFQEYCKIHGLSDLLAQWHPLKNGEATPADVSFGSNKKIWWKCEKGHEWAAFVYSRVSGDGCPVCTSRQVIPGENDLASHAPQIAAQWLQEKNGNLRPDQVTVSCNKSVWWQCEKGHSWKAPVASRTFHKTGCPYCSGNRVWKGFNDLQTLEPLIAEQWHPTLNEKLTPDMVTPGSHKRVWWRCSDGHVWQAIIYSRTGKDKCGCPVCSGKISIARRRRYEQIASEADKTSR